jgi:hypothetical protein
MVEPEQLASRHGDKLETMSEVTRKTEYETGLTVCSSDGESGTEHSKQPVVGEKDGTRGSSCHLGTTSDTVIHTHNESPPSATDLRRLSNGDEDHCVLINDVEIVGEEVHRERGSSTLLCMESDSLDREEIEQATRTDGEPYMTTEDLERLQQVVDVKTLSG